jgi:hypothetical protein
MFKMTNAKPIADAHFHQGDGEPGHRTVRACYCRTPMTPARPGSEVARDAVRVHSVDFGVPGMLGTVGPRFAGWRDAVDCAKGTIERFEYPGQVVKDDQPDYHPLRHVQEGGVLVHYSRAFVQMRTITTPGPGSGSPIAGTDGVEMTWEVFRDGSVEVLRRRTTEGN